IDFGRDVEVYSVNESGASVYSASALAREEFPDHDVTVRGAVSIGRRLLDPLAELVKIDPQSIGVGQYQHDVDQTALREALDFTVMSCVNRVGVNLNTASAQLLSYVSGLGPAMARKIVDYRAENGDFATRSDLLKVPRLGEKTYQQCAGFLRIPGSPDPLDNTAVHPQDYKIVERMAKDMGCDVSALISDRRILDSIDLTRYVTPDRGMPTLTDIMAELRKPGRDPRMGESETAFSASVETMEQLAPGMELNGIVNNITAFGVFVDVGVKESGLVHVSELSDRYVSSPSDVVRLNQHVRVKVLDIDLSRRRISLTMKGVMQ
ncbi:MAG: helix-hairpin-helix domain-containing protein, partial [Muribaculaceae bacterium]|nr:helix-hairpin-helix domain-containing protein [Muribaculaceae bacterium]